MFKPKKFTIDNLSLQEFDQDAEFIPLLSSEDEEEMNNENVPETLSILPLRNMVLFPGVVIPITAGRDRSIKLLQDANKKGISIGVVAQKDEDVEEPSIEDLHTTGVVAKILKIFKMPDGNTTVIIQGKKRFEMGDMVTEQPFITAVAKDLPDVRPVKEDPEFIAIIEKIKELALEIIKESPNIPSEASFAIKNIESDSFLVNFVSSNMNLKVEEKQKVLEI